VFKRVVTYLAGGFVTFIAYQLISTTMYTYSVVSFYGEDYSYEKHGFALNGKGVIGDVINSHDLMAYKDDLAKGEYARACRDVQSERGRISITYIGGSSVCCELSDNNQWLVPYRDEGDTRHYLCGAWPFLDHVTQKIESSKLASEQD
jgi:hypothetical protein